ncbi:MAG: 5-formyltetrahydrofolate cyclo-ligase [Flavobacteriaceae bacterium]
MDKNSLRVEYKKQRELLTAQERLEKSFRLTNRLLSLPLWEKTYFHLFLSSTRHKEVETEQLLTLLQEKDKEVVIPRMETKNNLSHVLLTDATPIKENRFGIPEPIGGISLSPQQMEVVFVPLLAYDKKGQRLGYGKGYYDRFLAECSPSCLFVGLSFFPPEEQIPFEETDIPLHYCVTPERVYSFV